MNRVLIIEDDPDIALSLRYSLEGEGDFTVTLVADGERGLEAALRDVPDIVLLDLNLPGLDGTEVCRRLREESRTADVPLIMLTARVQERDVLDGLAGGADDYVTKPFSINEVIARVRSLLRRSRAAPVETDVLSVGGVELDRAQRRVFTDGREVALTRKEFDLLAELMRRPERVATRSRLLEEIWSYRESASTRTVDVHIRQLRKKLGEPAADRIETVVGVGYRFRGGS